MNKNLLIHNVYIELNMIKSPLRYPGGKSKAIKIIFRVLFEKL